MSAAAGSAGAGVAFGFRIDGLRPHALMRSQRPDWPALHVRRRVASTCDGPCHLGDSGARLSLEGDDRLEDESVVLDLQGSRYFAINDTGTLLWPLLAEGATRTQLVAAVRKRWAIGDAQATGDVDAFCAELDAEGMLEP